MSASDHGSHSRSESAVRVGAALVALGTVASIATLLPLALDVSPLPTAVYLLCFLAPLGLGVILIALWRRAAGRSGRLRRADEVTSSD